MNTNWTEKEGDLSTSLLPDDWQESATREASTYKGEALYSLGELWIVAELLAAGPDEPADIEAYAIHSTDPRI